MFDRFFIWFFCKLLPRYSILAESYFYDELPSDCECDDLSNKLKWAHLYKRRK
jgi:hypothetical protein